MCFVNWHLTISCSTVFDQKPSHRLPEVTIADCSRVCLNMQSSIHSEMKDLSFAHVENFAHRQIPEAGHGFGSGPDFLNTAAKDIANEAFAPAFAKGYPARHQQPPKYVPCSKAVDQTVPRLAAREIGQWAMRMPKHIIISQQYTSSLDNGDMPWLQRYHFSNHTACSGCSACFWRTRSANT